MLKNYFVAAIRNLYKNKGFTVINILGLSIGLASFVLISLYVYHESQLRPVLTPMPVVFSGSSRI